MMTYTMTDWTVETHILNPLADGRRIDVHWPHAALLVHEGRLPRNDALLALAVGLENKMCAVERIGRRVNGNDLDAQMHIACGVGPVTYLGVTV